MSRCPHCGGKHAAENHFCPATGQPIELGPRLISQNLLERFRVVTILGEGPIGIVVEVEEFSTGDRYAAKLIHPQFSRNAQCADKLLDDAMRSGNLGSPHIAKVVQVGRDTGAALTVVRELMTGQCLQMRIEELGRLEIEEAIRITREILVALDAIHNAGMVNLDLSPADVFLAESADGDCVKLVDIGERHIKQEIVLETDNGFESVNFYAPEQYDRSRQVNPRSDIYAAGAILYNMITGVVPSGTPEPVSTLRQGIPFELAQSIHTALASTPHNRYGSAAEFSEALAGVSEKMALESDQPASTPEAASGYGPPVVEMNGERVSYEPDGMPGVAESPTADQYQPSVIVDMPEMEQKFPLMFTKKFRFALVIGAVLVLLIGIWMALFSGQQTDDEETSLKEIVISVIIDPSRATISVDGKKMEGNPVTLTVTPDDSHHTIEAKADGFEPLERDVKFDRTQRIELSLTEIISPDEDSAAAPLEDTAPTVAQEAPQAEMADSPEAKKESEGVEPSEAGQSPPDKPQDEKVARVPAAKSKSSEKTTGRSPTGPTRKMRAQKSRQGSAQKKKTKTEFRNNTQFPKTPSRPKKKKSREGFSTRNPFG